MFAGMEIDGKLDLHEVAYEKVNAQRKVWQQRGELSRVTSETLLSASSTFIDLLTAKTGEAIAREVEAKLQSLLEHAERVAVVERASQVDVARIRAELEAQRQTISRVRSQGVAAAAKLIYLLGLDPSAELLPIDGKIIAFDLVDATAPVEYLVKKAETSGPGVREMEELLAVIQQGIEQGNGFGKYLPIFEVRMDEGSIRRRSGRRHELGQPLGPRFAGAMEPHGSPDVAGPPTRRRRQGRAGASGLSRPRREARSRGPRARETILSGRDQIALGERAIEDASRAFDLSDRRLRLNQQSKLLQRSPLGPPGLGPAQVNYLNRPQFLRQSPAPPDGPPRSRHLSRPPRPRHPHPPGISGASGEVGRGEGHIRRSPRRKSSTGEPFSSRTIGRAMLAHFHPLRLPVSAAGPLDPSACCKRCNLRGS